LLKIGLWYAHGISADGPVGIFPPLLGQKSARWPDVFALIKRPALCWAVWGPTKTLDQFENVDNLWAVYTVGDPVFNSTMMQTGVKPPLQLVENYFHSDWRTSDDVSVRISSLLFYLYFTTVSQERKRLQKSWQRFREIPEWIATSANHRHVSPSVIISELNVMRTTNGTTQKSLNWLSGKVADLRKAMVTNSSAPILVRQSIQVAPFLSPSRSRSRLKDHSRFCLRPLRLILAWTRMTMHNSQRPQDSVQHLNFHSLPLPISKGRSEHQP
jgi:predicted Holliday junction resolvase-like endonuclease